MKLTDEQCIRLVTGKGTWHTNDCSGILPSLHLSDGPNGLRSQDETAASNNDSRPATCFPTESAIAASWDIQAVSDMASAIADEALWDDVSILLGPGVNIKRSPLCGRNFEYFSEDPYLSGVLGTAYIRAVQAKGIGTSLKHFAGNSQETRRQTQNSEIDERALREIYLTAFEMAVKEGAPATVMASYNRLNGAYSCENPYLLTDILRKEWGYQGTVISDWGACTDLTASLAAGLDLEMPDSLGVHASLLKQDLQNGRISMDTVRQAAEKVQALVMQYQRKPKMFSNQSANAGTENSSSEKNEPSSLNALLSQNHDLARRLSAQSAVLLKNDGILPLTDFAMKIAVIGDLAEHMRFQGGGSSHIRPVSVTSAVSALEHRGYRISFEKGYDSLTDAADEVLSEKAEVLAKASDLVLFFGGLTEHSEGEGYDRKTLALPSNQIALLQKLCEADTPVVLVSFGGSPFTIPYTASLHAILHMYLGGEAVGEAVCDLLSGDAAPSGKLAETFPLSASDIPCLHNFAPESDDVEYRESIFVGYRYYDTFQVPVQFPFGFGLSYTTFEYSDLAVSPCQPLHSGTSPEHMPDGRSNVFSGGELQIRFRIKNTGSRAGAEIAQLYVQNPPCKYPRAAKELRGFSKVFLRPGEEKNCAITLTDRSFSIYDTEEQKFVIASGTYGILLGASSQDIRLSMEIQAEGNEISRDDRECLPSYFNGSIQDISEAEFARLYKQPFSHFDREIPGCFTPRDSLARLSRHSLLGRLVYRFALKEAYGMFPGKSPDDPEVRMTTSAITEGPADCVALQSGGALPYKIINAIVFSANRHPFKAIRELICGKTGGTT